MSDREPLAPQFASRRARREAERAAEAATRRIDADIAVPSWLQRTPIAPTRPQPRPVAAPSRRARVVSKVVVSLGAMVSVVGLAVGLSVPAAATFGAPAPLDAAPEATAPLQLAAAPAPTAPAARFDLSAPASASLATGISRAEATFASESKADILRALYLSTGRPHEPGFIPTTGSVRWPFPESVEVSSGFGPRDLGDHFGTDFVPGYGTPVGAIADGIVTWVGRDGTNFGYYVTIAHVIDGVRVDSLYAHLVDDSSAGYGLYPGLEVQVGDLIGDTGNTGFSTGPHLHLEIHLEGVPVNPYEWLTVNAR